MGSPPLTRIVPWSQELACEVLRSGDLAVDLTAGKGRDTLVLAKAVGPEGQVVTFDLQTKALEQTTELLRINDFTVSSWSTGQVVPMQPGIYPIHACHSTLEKVLPNSAKVIMANLGYFPGGDQSLVTRPDSTLAALQQSLNLLIPGGRLLVTVYPAHPGGDKEGAAVDKFFCTLPSDQWKVLSLRAANCNEAPYLLVAERTFKQPPCL